MLLFVTNLLAILLAGGGVLLLMGLSAASTAELVGKARRRVFALIAFGMLLVTVPLGITSITVARETNISVETQKITERWLAGTDFELLRLDVVEDHARLLIDGSGDPSYLSELGDELQTELEGVEFTLKIVPSRTLRFPKDGSGSSKEGG